MAKELRTILLSKILSSEGVYHGKYTGAYNTLRAVIELEKKETDRQKLPQEYFKKFEDITKKLNCVDERVKGFPLMVLEQYFVRSSSQLDRYIYMVYGELESASDYKVIELFEILEGFFMELYMLAVEIADYYSLEIKLKKTGGKDGTEATL